MNPDLERLLELQRADAEIARLNAEIASLPKKVAAIEAKLAGSKAEVEQARAALKNNESARRKHEGEIQALQQKISKYRDQQLEVKTNDQYKALTHEITHAENEIRGLEDKILDAMVDTEAQEKKLKAAEADLKEETAEIQKEQAEVRARTAEDEKQLADWNGQRDRLRAGISGDVLPHYDRVVKLRGTGIAEVHDDQKCTACYVMVRPQKFNDLRTNQQVLTCDSCGRILVYVAPPVAAPPADAEAHAESPVTR